MKTINRKYSYRELLKQKMEDLDIKDIYRENIGYDLKPYIIENNYTYRTIIKLNLAIPVLTFDEEDQEKYYVELTRLFSQFACKIRFINKTIDLSTTKLGYENQNEISTPNKKGLNIEECFTNNVLNQFKYMNKHQEYYLELEEKNKHTLINKIHQIFSFNKILSLFRLSIPTEREMKYLIEEVTIGLVNCKYYSNYIQVNPDSEYEYYVKYLLIDNFNKDVPLSYWEQIIRTEYDTMISFKPYNKFKSNKIITNAIEEKKFEYVGKKDTDKDNHQAEKEALQYLNAEINLDREKLCELNIVVKIEAKTLEDLNREVMLFKEQNSNYFIIRDAISLTERLDTYYSGIDDHIFGSKVMSLSNFIYGAGIYASSYIEDNGYPYNIGHNDSILVLNRRKRKPSIGLTNYNCSFIGQTGSGKSSAIKNFMIEDYVNGDTIIALDFAREYDQIVSSLGGTYIDCNADNIFLNPFELILKNTINEEGLEEVDFINQNIDYMRLYKFTKLLIENIKISEIEFSNAMQFLVEETTKYFPNEVISFQLLNKFINENNLQVDKKDSLYTLILIIKNICQNRKIFSQQSNININNRVVCFNIQNERDDNNFVCALSYLIIRLTNKLMVSNKFNGDLNSKLTYLEELIEYGVEKNINLEQELIEIDNKAKELDLTNESASDYNIKLFQWRDFACEILETKIQAEHPKIRLYIDECHNILKKGQEEIIRFIDLVAREGRKYNSSITLGTQTLDIFENEDVNAIFQNIPMNFFMQIKQSNIEQIDKFTNAKFTKSQKDFLINSNPGEGICLLGQNKFIIKLNISKELLDLMRGGN